jgi:3-deoxy-7-phosphoheptulonate synthase / chorismate mutase
MNEPDNRISDLRARIGANDAGIVAAVNERLRLVAELWELKAAQGTERLDPDRERRLREELAAANAGPLSAEGLEALVTELLALTKRELSG